MDMIPSEPSELRLPNLEDLITNFSEVKHRGIVFPVQITQEGRLFKFRVDNSGGTLKEVSQALSIVNGLTYEFGRYLMGKIDYSFYLTLPTPNYAPKEHTSDTFESFDFTMKINNKAEYEAAHAHYDYD